MEIEAKFCEATEFEVAMNDFTAIIRNDYRVSRESIYDIRVEIARLADVGVIGVEYASKEILVVRGGEFIGWLSLSRNPWTGYDSYLERPTSDRERMLWQMLVDMLD